MRKFLIQVVVFIGLIAVFFFIVIKQADGYTDPFYLRFTTPKQSSLIIGTSRAAQGIQPAVLNKMLNRNDIYNYAFTIGHSPYGPTYLSSIISKLNSKSKNGVFIIAVDPWCISSTGKDPNNIQLFEERDWALGNTKFTNLNPNPFYLIKNYDKSFYNFLIPPKRKEMFLHDDGWLEVTIDMDSATVKQRLEEKIKEYRKGHLTAFKFSNVRFRYLKQTIDLLKDHGMVYLVRLPVHPQMMEIEVELMRDFNGRMMELAKNKKIPYFDLTYLSDSLVYTDGNHLYKKSGRIVSQVLGELVLKKQ